MGMSEYASEQQRLDRKNYGENPLSPSEITQLYKEVFLPFVFQWREELGDTQATSAIQADLLETHRLNKKSKAFAAGLYTYRTAGAILEELRDEAYNTFHKNEFIMWHDIKAGFGLIVEPLVNFEAEVAERRNPVNFLIEFENIENPHASRAERRQYKKEAKAYTNSIRQSLKKDPTGKLWVTTQARVIHETPYEKPYIGIPEFVSGGAVFGAALYNDMYSLLSSGNRSQKP